MNTASPDDIDISVIWHSLRKSVPKLLALSLAAGIGAYVVLSFATPEYTSEAQIQLVAPKREVQANDPASADALAARMDKEAINTHVRALMSPDLAVEVIAAEGLANKPEFNSALQPPTLVSRILHVFDFGHGTETEQERVLRAYFDRLDVYSPKESRFIGIRFTSQDPKLAAAVANKLAELYRTSLATRTVAETDEVQKALQPKIDKLMKEVAEAEAAVERFRGEANIFKGGPTDTGLNQQQLADLNAELTKAQAARSEAEAKAAAAREMVRAGNAESLPDVQKSPLIENLVQQRVRLERQLSELSATLLPAHPRMRQIQADLEGLQRQIKAEVGKIVEGIEKGAQAAALHEAAAKKNLDDMKARVVDTGGDQVKLRQLETVAKSKRQELEQLQARFEANRARADSQAVPIEAQIITSARPSSVPSFPKKLPYSALVAVAFLLFGIAIVVTKALFAAARVPGAQVAWQGTPALARAGAKPQRSGVERAAAVSAGVMHTVDSVPALAGQLLVRPPDIGGFRTLITGETEGIDPGAAGVDLAKALADAGADVMLVDWSPDGHGVAEAIGAQTHPGLAELLQGKARFEDVVARVPGSAAHLIPAGAVALRTEEMLDPDQINLALDALDTAYDHIVVVGSNQAARALFEAIQGRFDAGVIVSEGKRRAKLTEPPGTFLGFEVADIELFKLERPLSNRLVQERLARLTAKGGAEARPA
ncbi:MAG TPA: exopolysaccharide transport family protein [Hyphomicrobium sp.]|nr:exopolysaccharide transport family protein [Hyphomicrobium sp.]